ncbi:hypothetical protein [Sediminitomix flava]|nr:hypothetical protein [Sediminitomix flava]
MKRLGSVFLLMMTCAVSLFAQTTDIVVKEKEGCDEKGWCWGADIDATKSKWTFFSDEVKAKSYASAEANYLWLLENVPYINKGLYVYGEKMYKALVKAEQKAKGDKVTYYEDQLLALYDYRAAYYPKSKNSMLNKKGLVYMPYIKDRGEMDWKNVYDFYNSVIEANGNKTYYPNIQFFFSSVAKLGKDIPVYRQKIENKEKKIPAIEQNIENFKKADQPTAEFEKQLEAVKAEIAEIEAERDASPYNEEWVLDEYDRISAILNYQLENAKNEKAAAPVRKVQSFADQTLNQIVQIDCDFVTQKLAPKFKADPTDGKLAEKMFGYMLKFKCREDNPELFLESAVAFYNYKPQQVTATLIATQYANEDKLAESEEWYTKALELSGDDVAKQAAVRMSQARLYYKQGKKSAAREAAKKAAELDQATAADAYSFIGDMYMGSGQEYIDPSDAVKTRFCYLAAYDMYAKAGNSKKMAAAKKQFPSKVDVFTLASKYKEGSSYSVGGWIGGTTTLRIRPE